MKIGIVLPSVPTYSETFFSNQIIGLTQQRFEVVIFVNDHNSKDMFLGCKVLKAPLLSGNLSKVILKTIVQGVKAVFVHPKRSLKLYRLNKNDGIPFKNNLKFIIANQFLLSESLDWLHFGFGTMAINRENVAQAIGAKMAVSFRGFDHYVYPIKNRTCYRSLFSKNVMYHVLSDGMKTSLVFQNIKEHKIKKITPAIDLSFFQQVKSHQQPDVVQIVTIARLHWIKGLEYTLHSLAILKNANIPFHYTIIGEGIERERLVFATHQLGLSEQITFTGKLPHNQVKTTLENADIYLQYSIQEGFCNAVLEAQAMGLLCVVSDAEGLSENVLHNQTGWVVEKRNPKLLASKIMEVVDLEVNKKEEIRQQAVERVQKEFNLEKQQEEFLAFYTI